MNAQMTADEKIRDVPEWTMLGDPNRWRVEDVMSRPVRTVTGQVTLGRALELLLASGLRHLVVVDDKGRCIGVLPDRTIVSAWALDPACLDRSIVAHVLFGPAATVDCAEPVVAAARTMRRLLVDAVAAVDGEGRVVGVLTAADLVALMSESADALAGAS